MKHLLMLFCLTVLLGCNGKKAPEEIKTVVLYSENDRVPDTDGKVKIIIKDTMCPFEKKRAWSDIKKGKLKIHFTFLNFRRNYDDDSFHNLNKHLSKYNITVDTVYDKYSSGCIHTGHFELYCYQNTMREEIERKYGKKFLDSLCYLVQKEHVRKNPDKFYEWNQCDMISRYPGTKDYNDMFDKSANDFFKQFHYPRDYKFKNERSYSHTSASFLLSKTGKISNLKTEAVFHNPTNEKYKSYFESEVAKFIKTVKFIPAKNCGITVNSRMDLSFQHK